MQTPIILIIFNRSGLTERVLEAIRQARPERLFVVADGPRAAVLDTVDWPCEAWTPTRNDSGSLTQIMVSSVTSRTTACWMSPFFRYCEEILVRDVLGKSPVSMDS